VLLIPKRHRRTDGRTDGRLTVALPRSALASRGNKMPHVNTGMSAKINVKLGPRTNFLMAPMPSFYLMIRFIDYSRLLPFCPAIFDSYSLFPNKTLCTRYRFQNMSHWLTSRRDRCPFMELGARYVFFVVATMFISCCSLLEEKRLTMMFF